LVAQLRYDRHTSEMLAHGLFGDQPVGRRTRGAYQGAWKSRWPSSSQVSLSTPTGCCGG